MSVPPPSPPQRWPEVARDVALKTPVFEVQRVAARSPRTAATGTFYVLDVADWVNVIARTEDGCILFVRQYRHGIKDVTLEIPGGVIDSQDASPADAAGRELLEETGYRAAHIEALGRCAPNPAMQSNWCYTFVASDLRLESQQLDPNEDIQVVKLPVAEVRPMLDSGAVSHSLVLVAFYLALGRI